MLIIEYKFCFMGFCCKIFLLTVILIAYPLINIRMSMVIVKNLHGSGFSSDLYN